jgi:ELWxxDGT repeat protein
MQLIKQSFCKRVVLASVLAASTVASVSAGLQSASAAVGRPTSFSILKENVEVGRQRLSGNFAVLGGKTYFSGKSAAEGDELWVTDGTPAGTTLVKDIRTGSSPSYPHYFYTVGGKVLFVANDGVNGTELWVTDGTSAGTVLLKDIEAGSGSSIPGATADISSGSGARGDGMNVINGKLYFSAVTTAAGREPWVSDGTAAGTQMIADVNSGATGSMATTAGPFTPAGTKVDKVGCPLEQTLKVLFDFDSAELRPESITELERVVTFMNDVPFATSLIEGHTDSIGTEAYNLKLSDRRAKAVYEIGRASCRERV